jgi:hypothetical protein
MLALMATITSAQDGFDPGNHRLQVTSENGEPPSQFGRELLI